MTINLGTGTNICIPGAPRLNVPNMVSYLPGLTVSPFGSSAPPSSTTEQLLLPEGWCGQRHSFRPIVILLTGRRGSGKTLGLTAIMRYQQRRNIAAGYPCRVLANYHVAFADRSDAYILDELMNYPEWARNIILGIDEIGSCFPNRRSLASINLLFLQFVGQIRKRATEIAATTRFAVVVDQQHAMEIDLFLRCHAFYVTDGSGHVKQDVMGRPIQGIDFDIWDYWGQWTDDVRRKYWPPNLEPVDETRTIINVQTMWDCYSTDEVIVPMWLRDDQRRKILANEWQELAFKEESELQHAKDVQPTNFQELFTQSGPFNVTSMLSAATRFMPELENLARPAAKKLLAERLRQEGFEIETMGQQYVARRKSG